MSVSELAHSYNKEDRTVPLIRTVYAIMLSNSLEEPQELVDHKNNFTLKKRPGEILIDMKFTY